MWSCPLGQAEEPKVSGLVGPCTGLAGRERQPSVGSRGSWGGTAWRAAQSEVTLRSGSGDGHFREGESGPKCRDVATVGLKEPSREAVHGHWRYMECYSPKVMTRVPSGTWTWSGG